MRIQMILANAQSNEKGSGEANIRNPGMGTPLSDPIGPYGTEGNGSMWPRLAELAGADGHQVFVRNTARSSSSGVMAWTGALYEHQPSKTFCVGAYVVANGNIYKGTNSTGASINGVTGPTAPTWPASGSVVDGAITWTYQRPATSADVIGTVLAEGNPLFDPNGYLAGAHNFAIPLDKFDLNIVLLQNGQQDATISTPRARYAQCILNAGDYYASRGWVPMVGFTVYAPSLATWMDSDLIPAIDDVLAARPAWKRGANLRQALGDLPTNPASGPGLRLETPPLHANNAALRLGAGHVWAAMREAFGL